MRIDKQTFNHATSILKKIYKKGNTLEAQIILRIEMRMTQTFLEDSTFKVLIPDLMLAPKKTSYIVHSFSFESLQGLSTVCT